MSTPTLYHFTCAHWAPFITADGVVKPARVYGWPDLAFAWFTDLEVGYREALGLTSTILNCDRTAHRFRVTDDTDVTRWVDARRGLPATYVASMHSPPGVMPAHWWISTTDVPAVPS